MMYDFQITYSVHPRGDSQKAEKAAASVRRILREIPGWETVDDIETVLVGVLNISANTKESRRKEAEGIVEKKIQTLVDELDVYSDVWVYVSLMVDQLGSHIKFRV